MTVSRNHAAVRVRRLIVVGLLSILAFSGPALAEDQAMACYQQCEAARTECRERAGGREWSMMGWCEYFYSDGTCMTEICVVTGLACGELFPCVED